MNEYQITRRHFPEYVFLNVHRSSEIHTKGPNLQVPETEAYFCTK
jgi:hypothetical protein